MKGGRYDNLLKHFGKAAPSIGFVMVVDQLLAALSRQNIQIPEAEPLQRLYYLKSQQSMAIHLAVRMRGLGKRVAMDCVSDDKKEKTKVFLELCKKYNIEE